jgi:hypothetical protein
MTRLSEKQKRERDRARGEEVFEPLHGSTVKAMFNLIRNLYGNPHNLGTAVRPFTEEYDWKQLQAKATLADYLELLRELAKTDEGAYDKLYKADPTVALTFPEYKKDNPQSPTKLAELKAKYNPDIYLITDDERKYATGGHSEARQQADQAFRAKSEAYYSQRSAGPPPEAVALSTKSATQSAGGEPPRALPKDSDVLSHISSDVLSTPGRERPKFGSVIVKALEKGEELPDIKALLKLSDQEYYDLILKRQKLTDERLDGSRKFLNIMYPEARGELDTYEMLKQKTAKIFEKFKPMRQAQEEKEQKEFLAKNPQVAKRFENRDIVMKNYKNKDELKMGIILGVATPEQKAQASKVYKELFGDSYFQVMPPSHFRGSQQMKQFRFPIELLDIS